MKVGLRHYPGRATAIGPAAMEFQYEANWQEVTQKWGLQEREKRAAQTVKDISRIGVKLPGLANRDVQETRDTKDGNESITVDLEEAPKKQPSPAISSASSLERQLNSIPNKTKLPSIGFELRRSGSDLKNEFKQTYSELEQRYQIITPKDVGSIPENLGALVLKKHTEANKQETSTQQQNGNTKHKIDSFGQVKQTVISFKDGDKSRYHDEQDLVRSEVAHSGSGHARTMSRQVNGRDLQEPAKSDLNHGSSHIMHSEAADQSPRPMPRSESTRTKPLHQRNPNDVISPPPPKMRHENPPLNKFRTEPPPLVPKRMDAFKANNTPISNTSYEYPDYSQEYDDIPKPTETLELQPIPPALRPVRVQPREDEIVSSWAARKRRELQQEKQRRKAQILSHHPYEEIDSWEVDEDMLYNGNISKKGKGSHKTQNDEFPSNSSGGRQKSNSSDLLRESFRIEPKERTSSLDSGHFEGNKLIPVPFSKFNGYHSDSLEGMDCRVYPRRLSPDESAIEPDSLNPIETQESEFIIPRPKLIVPVHTYGIRKRRTGNNMLHTSRRGSDADTVLSGNTVSDKKHHTSCPGMSITIFYTFVYNI